MHFPNSIHAEGWNPRQQLSSGDSSMTPLHAQGAAPMRRQTMPLVLLGVTLSLVAGAAALSTMFSPKSAEQQWQAIDGLAAPGAGADQIAQAPVSTPAPLPEPSPVVETAEPAATSPQLQPEPRPAEPARPAVTPPVERKPQPVTKTLAPSSPVPLMPPVIDPPAVVTLPQPATSLPPIPASVPASTPASAPPAPQPASVPASSPASDPPKSDPPKPQAPVVEPPKIETPEAPKAPPIQG